MQTRSMLLALLTTIMWSTTTEAQVIQTLDEIGNAQFAVDIEHEHKAPWLVPYSHSTLKVMKLPEAVFRPTLQSHRSISTEPWEEEWSVPLPFGAAAKDVLKSINDIWAAERNWTNVSRADNSDVSVWEFVDKTGNHWVTTARAESSRARNRCVCSIIITLRAVVPQRATQFWRVGKNYKLSTSTPRLLINANIRTTR